MTVRPGAPRPLGAWVYGLRRIFGVLLFVALVGLLLAITASLLGFAWPPGWFRPLTISDEVLALLAVGTLALAYAAVLQATSSLEEVRVGAEREVRRYRPNLVLTFFDSTDSLDRPQPAGPILAIRNLGPGVARSAYVTFLGYPGNQSAMDARNRLAIPQTSLFGAGRPYLDAGSGPASLWLLHSEVWPGDPSIEPIVKNLLDIDGDFVVEIGAEDLIGNRQPVSRFHLQRREVQRLEGPAPMRNWVWFTVSSPKDTVESIQEILDAARAGTWRPPWQR